MQLIRRDYRGLAAPPESVDINTGRLYYDGWWLEKYRRWRQKRQGDTCLPANLALAVISGTVISAFDPAPRTGITRRISVMMMPMLPMTMVMPAILVAVSQGWHGRATDQGK
ncbi:MAG: hypothetical protein D3M94_11935 [Rhodocyclales bacterium GT-UBC]|nr:MAG: hypothetical protein D3M94_11935 [Rhodocyclales bacterium GT-UBC]